MFASTPYRLKEQPKSEFGNLTPIQPGGHIKRRLGMSFMSSKKARIRSNVQSCEANKLPYAKLNVSRVSSHCTKSSSKVSEETEFSSEDEGMFDNPEIIALCNGQKSEMEESEAFIENSVRKEMGSENIPKLNPGNKGPELAPKITIEMGNKPETYVQKSQEIAEAFVNIKPTVRPIVSPAKISEPITTTDEDFIQCGQFPSSLLENIMSEDFESQSANHLHGLSKLFEESLSAVKSPERDMNVDFDSEPWEDLLEPARQTQPVENLGPFYGMPETVKELLLKHRKIKQLYDWQEECLKNALRIPDKNLVYALPTSGGKTLVAEVLILRELICHKRSVLFVLPFVAIVQEKVRSLEPLAMDLDFLVEEYAAGKGTLPPRKRRRKRSTIIATIEKALAVVQSLIEAGRIDEIGLVVVDEIHLVGEEDRGSNLEKLITFLLHCKVRLVAMSATIGNIADISTFLNAECYSGNFRPVELTEYVKSANTIFRIEYKEESLLILDRQLPLAKNKDDPDNLAVLVEEVCPAGSVLVFCASKANCENVAQLLCRTFQQDMLSYKSAEKQALLTNLSLENGGQTCSILQQSLKYGVAYHHSGLTADERKLLEEAYRDGVVCCICCTSTLAAGVNLPAQRVILRAPYVGRDFMTLTTYKQMVGRAGRAGLGDKGESILICQSRDNAKVQKLLQSKMDDVVSSLNEERCADLLTSAVGLGVANTRPALRTFISRTLYSVQANRLNIDIKKMTDKIISTLLKNRTLNVVSGTGNFATIPSESVLNDKLEVTVPNQNPNQTKFRVTNTTVFCTTRLARAAMKGVMDLALAKRVYSDLSIAETRLNLQCDLHLLYLVTPYTLSDRIIPNKSVYFSVYSQLKEEEQQAAATIGLSEAVISRMAIGHNPKNTAVTNRLYCALMLSELMKQRGVWEVAALFHIPRGQVQSALQNANTFCNNLVRFCEEIEEFWALKAILAEFAPRLQFCCEMELVPLMDLPSVKRARARQLFSAGFKTIENIVLARPEDLVNVVSHLSHSQARRIIQAAKAKVHEMLENLKEDVDALASLDAK